MFDNVDGWWKYILWIKKGYGIKNVAIALQKDNGGVPFSLETPIKRRLRIA